MLAGASAEEIVRVLEDFIILSVVKLDGAFYMSLMNLSFSIQINKS